MLLEEFNHWLEEQCRSSDKEIFCKFAIEKYCGLDASLQDVLCDILWEIHQMQVCIEGLIEDQEACYED